MLNGQRYHTALILSLAISIFTISGIFGQMSDIRLSADNLTSHGKVRRQYQTTAVTGHAIRLDGISNEEAWNQVEWDGQFTQQQPHDGESATLPTWFKIIYDDRYLYMAFRCPDPSPDSIEQRLGRRDDFPGDLVEVNFDSYYDLRTAFSFTVSASGVRGDEFISYDGDDRDPNWNPIWDAATHIDSLGWYAELRIPFSQLRYGNQANPVWGLQVMRHVFRTQERSNWQHIPRNSNGWVSQFGELHGLKSLPVKRQIELAPYVIAQAERFEGEPGNPFADGTLNRFSAGIDGKISVTRDLILDFTVNPDFGQVEADPGAVRLDGYEIFFSERRPFFIESRNLFDYEITGSAAGGNFNDDLLFYSRRIGGEPHQYPETDEGEFASVPRFTSILGAAKFSGKTKKGLSIGILESITRREFSRISDGAHERKELAEPFTNYFVARIIQDIHRGNTIVGGILTSVNREPGLDLLHRSAVSGGIDVQHFWKNRWYAVKLNAIMSHVTGSADAILATQLDFVHLFQRSDARHLKVDPTRTSLTGTGGTLSIGKYGGNLNKDGGVLRFETGVTWRSPELELNDIGFLPASDEINHFSSIAYNLQQPFSIFRNANFQYSHVARWDFSGRFLYMEMSGSMNAWFKNNWRWNTFGGYNPHDISNNALRGASAIRRPPGYYMGTGISSDDSRMLYAQFNISGGSAQKKSVNQIGVGGSLNYQPSDAVRLSVAPFVSKGSRKQDQFVANIRNGDETRSIVSRVNYRQFSLAMRANYFLTPTLSVQYYGEPFIFRGVFDRYGYVKDPLNREYHERFHVYTPQEISIEDGVAFIDENQDGNADYAFHLPDANFIQYRSNLVLRWEYVAGSELYLVWSQSTLPDAYDDLNSPFVSSLFNHVFKQKPHNIFLVKVSYRFVN